MTNFINSTFTAYGLVLKAQTTHLDVERAACIAGKSNLIAGVGDFSVFIGANAGMYDDGSGIRNTFVGSNTGFLRTVIQQR